MDGSAPLYLVLALPAILLALYAHLRLTRAHHRYSEVANQAGLVGAEVARLLLKEKRLSAIQLAIAPGALQDEYDAQQGILRLPLDMAQSASIAALALVARQAGHALQGRDGFAWASAQSGLASLLTLAFTLSYLLLLGGLLSGSASLALLAVLVFSGSVTLSLLTLPGEFEANRRALRLLERCALLGDGERRQVEEMLRAAALLHVARAVQILALSRSYLTRALGADARRRGY